MLIFEDNAPSHRPARRTVRHGAYALIENDGRIAVDVLRTQTRKIVDLPGGGLEWVRTDKDKLVLGKDGRPILETEEQALIREVAEEIGLIVRPGARLAEAVQCYRSSDGRTDVLGYAALWTAEQVGEVPKTEPDHELDWLEPELAIRCLRHESHRLFVMKWLSWQQRNFGELVVHPGRIPRRHRATP